MNLLIGEEYKLTSDTYNIIVNQRFEKKGKDGEPSGEYDFKAVAYCANMEQAAKYLIDRNIRLADAENLAELVEFIAKTKRDIIQAVRAGAGNGSN